MGLLAKYAAAGIVALTAVPAGCVPLVTVKLLAGLVRVDDWKPNAPWTAWAIAIVFGIAAPVLISIATICVFFWFFRYVRRMEPGTEFLTLGRTSWQVLLCTGVLLGIATGYGFILAIDVR